MTPVRLRLPHARALMLGLAAAALWSAASAQPPPAPAVNPANGASARTEQGFGIFQQKCLSCHGKPEFERAPTPAALRDMTPERIYDALTTGIMAPVIGNQMSDQDRKLVAESISGRLMGTAASGDAAKMPNRCAANPPMKPPGAPGELRLVHRSGAALHLGNDGKVRIEGDLIVNGDIADRYGTLERLRRQYDRHSHPAHNAPTAAQD